MFISGVNEKKKKNFEIKFFSIFCCELYFVQFTPKD